MDYLNWVPKSVEDLLPASLKEPFRQKFLAPLQRADEENRLAEQRKLESEIAAVQAEIARLQPLLHAEREKDLKYTTSQRVPLRPPGR